jgi:UDP-N-acetylmuramoyl-L-alanyl-D-glutamate--2,6-diaminopimelate ligase
LKRVLKLDFLVNGLSILELQGRRDIEIRGLTNDSRAVQQGYLFVAIKGRHHDGHRFLVHAVEGGAHALVVEQMDKEFSGVSLVRVPDTRVALRELAARFYGYPTRSMRLIGITGTNGKTTTSYLLESIWREAGIRVGLIGTISYRFNGNSREALLTTPDYPELMRMVREMRDAGITDIIMEVSSHSLDQGRTMGFQWSRALFTNFSRDHLDYHATMEEYFQAKSRLFTTLGGGQGEEEAQAVINADDPKGRILEKMIRVPVVSYGLKGDCMVRAADIDLSVDGVRFTLVTPAGTVPITSSLLGRINVYNILGAAATAYSLEVELEAVKRGIEGLAYVPGRLQPVPNRRGLSVFVDYAHSPDALEKALKTLKPFVQGRLITVFGCGGDRDKGKRPEMGKAAGELSDWVILTSDNPRKENPAQIANEIEPGVREAGLRRMEQNPSRGERGYRIVLDRREAIRDAINAATDKDIVVIAGKGHEKYQIIGKRRVRFDDGEEVEKAAS